MRNQSYSLFCGLLFVVNFAGAADLQGTWRKEVLHSDPEYLSYVGDYLIFENDQVNQVERWGMENHQRKYRYEQFKTNSGKNALKVYSVNEIDPTNYEVWRYDLSLGKLRLCHYLDSYYNCENYVKTAEKFELRTGNHRVPNVNIIITTCVNTDCLTQTLLEGIVIRPTYDLISSMGGPVFPDALIGPNSCGTQFWGGLVGPDELSVGSYLAGMRILCKNASNPTGPNDVIFVAKPFFLSTTKVAEFSEPHKGFRLSVKVSVEPRK